MHLYHFTVAISKPPYFLKIAKEPVRRRSREGLQHFYILPTLEDHLAKLEGDLEDDGEDQGGDHQPSDAAH